MTEELKELGLQVGHRRIGRLMRDNGIFVKLNRKFKTTKDSGHSFNIAPNLVVVLDLYSRRAIGWTVSNRLKNRAAN